jgi:hypothetical protein
MKYKDEDLTPWFPAYVKPVRPGVYVRKNIFGTVIYSKWDGEHWCHGSGDFDNATTFWQDYFSFQYAQWFGVGYSVGGGTSFSIGSTTYFRGFYRGIFNDGESNYDRYGIFRTFPSTTTVAINTGVPSSGTISLSNFYGAVNS